MRAAVVPRIGGKWEVREVPIPQPSANQVLIKIHASGLCYTDVHITEGRLPIPIEFPSSSPPPPAPHPSLPGGGED